MKQLSVAALLVVLAILATSVHDVSAARPFPAPLPTPQGPSSYAPELVPSYAPEVAPVYAPEMAPVYAPEMSPTYAPEVSPPAYTPSYDVGPSPASHAPAPSSGA